ncbi:hypothetical protein CDAR_622601 [Caerostris darwini]|uniref:Uncharacterized protein n=1 Tax=Caerostris darwini TaxID=1538125 RepID=A0AAV4UAZ6_9ARAC|nr:hypothetical protein CDAR_622601 [Caerostris darwini]
MAKKAGCETDVATTKKKGKWAKASFVNHCGLPFVSQELRLLFCHKRQKHWGTLVRLLLVRTHVNLSHPKAGREIQLCKLFRIVFHFGVRG